MKLLIGATSLFDGVQFTLTGDENLNSLEADDNDADKVVVTPDEGVEELDVKLKFIAVVVAADVDFSGSFAAMPKLKLLVGLASDDGANLKSVLGFCCGVLTAMSIFGTDCMKGKAMLGRLTGAGGSSSSTCVFFELTLELAVTLFLIFPPLCLSVFCFCAAVGRSCSPSKGNLYSQSRFKADFEVLAICRERSVQFCIFFICKSCDIDGTCSSLRGGKRSFFESLLLLLLLFGFKVTAGRV